MTAKRIAEIELFPSSPLWQTGHDPEAVLVHELLEAKLFQGFEGVLSRFEEAAVSQLARALYLFHKEKR